MENNETAKKKSSFNLEKIGVYITCLGFIYLFWQAQLGINDKILAISDKISDMKERIAKLEVKVEKLEEKI